MAIGNSEGDLVLQTKIEMQKKIDEVQTNVLKEINPNKNKPLYAEKMCLQDELRCAKQLILTVRRKALRELLENEYKTFEEELNKAGMGFIRM